MDKLDEWMKRAFDLSSKQKGKPQQANPKSFSGNINKEKQFKRTQPAVFKKPQERRFFHPNQKNQKQQIEPRPQMGPQRQGAKKQSNFSPKRPEGGTHQHREQSPAQREKANSFAKKHQINNPAKRGEAGRVPYNPKRGASPQDYIKSAAKHPQKLKSHIHSVLTHQPPKITKGKLKIIPLGGLNEIGKNMIVLEYEEDILIVDMGLEFPNEDLYGIDYVIPDVTYLEENKKRIRGVLITHGHLDHTGGIPYILPKLDFPPVFATKLTLGLIKKKIEEFNLEKMARLREVNPDEHLRLGKFLCTFFRVAHSIPDSVGTVIETPEGKIVHTGDFKFDDYPAGNQKKADLHKMEALGRSQVLALLCESTNALKEGYSMPEQKVGEVLDNLVRDTKGRFIIASFASQIGRIQQIIDAGVKHHRKIFISGRSMQDNIEISTRLGYLKIPKDSIRDIRKYKNVPDHETLILTTGSQGESISALARIADGEHPHVKVRKGDTIVLSSSPIIGNERAIYNIINKLSILGAKVIYSEIMDVHTSGHGKREDLKRMINYIKPKYFVPIHGEYYMRQSLAELAVKECGIPENRIIMLQNGEMLTSEKGIISKSKETVETKYILIDGLGEGHVGSEVQIDREIMSENGALIVLVHINRKSKKLLKTPDIISRGFIYRHETDEITREISEIAGKAYRNIMEKNPGVSRQDIKRYIKETVDRYTTSKLERRPLIVPLIIES